MKRVKGTRRFVFSIEKKEYNTTMRGLRSRILDGNLSYSRNFRAAREFANSQLPRDPDTGRLYPYFSTSLKDFGKIGGPGVSLYFDFLKQASLVMASCFMFSMAFFLRNYAITAAVPEVPAMLRGSLVFPNGTNPRFEDFGGRWDANVMEAGVFLSFVFFAVSIGRHQRILADEIDDIYSTAQDYTVCVRRPPSACFSCASDVRDYFERSVRCKVVAVTLERDNVVLCRAREDFSIHLHKVLRILRDDNPLAFASASECRSGSGTRASSGTGTGTGAVEKGEEEEKEMEEDVEAVLRDLVVMSSSKRERGKKEGEGRGGGEDDGCWCPSSWRRLLWSACLCRDVTYHVWMMRQAAEVARCELRKMLQTAGGDEGAGANTDADNVGVNANERQEWNHYALGRPNKKGPTTEPACCGTSAMDVDVQMTHMLRARKHSLEEGVDVGSAKFAKPTKPTKPTQQGSMRAVPPPGSVLLGRRRSEGSHGGGGGSVLFHTAVPHAAIAKRNFDLITRGGSTVMVSSSSSSSSFSTGNDHLNRGGGRLMLNPTISPRSSSSSNFGATPTATAATAAVGGGGGTMTRTSERLVRAFVTFQTEHQQRRVLRYLRRGWCERMVALDPVARCDTSESPEPSDVIWDMGIWSWMSVKLRSSASWLSTATTIAVCFYVTSLLQALRVQQQRDAQALAVGSAGMGAGAGVDGYQQGVGGGENLSEWRIESATDVVAVMLPGVVISVINWLLPVIISASSTHLEKHESYSSRERSASLKLVIGRVCNTALVPFLATPGPSLLHESVLQKIVFLQISNFVVSNLLRFLDPGTLWVRYVHGYFARTQADLEDLWVGGEWFISERYSDVISIISIAAFFGPLIPVSYAIAAATLWVAYWNDKYLLLRYWRRPPELDTTSASYASRFFVTTLVVHLLVASWITANWPLTSVSAQTLRWEVGVPEVDFSDKTYWRQGMGVMAVVLVVAAGMTFAISLFVGAERCCSKGAVEVFRGSAGASGRAGPRSFTRLRPRPRLYTPLFRVPGSDYARFPGLSCPPPSPPTWAGMEIPVPSRTEVEFFISSSSSSSV